MAEFTKEMLEKLYKANEAVKGTPYYTKYEMQADTKVSGRWKYMFWSIPKKTGIIRTYKHTTYIITEDGFDRYTVTYPVKELLGI